MQNDAKHTSAASLKAKLRSASSHARYIPETLRLVWDSSGGWTIAWVVLLLLQGLLPIAIVYLMRAVVNALVAASAAGADWSHIRTVLFLAAPLGAVMLLTEVLRSVASWVGTIRADLVSCRVADLLHQKCVEADLALYETPEFYDQLHQARFDAAHRPLALVESIGGLFQNGVTLVGMAAVLIPFGFWLPLVLVVRTLPAFYAVFHFARVQYAWRAKVAPDERRLAYCDWLFFSNEPAAEVRLFRTGDHFREIYQKLRLKLRAESMALKRREALGELCASGLSLVITAATLAWITWRAVRGPLVLGDLVLFYQAFNQGQQVVRSLLDRAEQIFSSLLFLGKFYEFLGLETQVAMPARPVSVPPLKKGIRFENVTFHYPGRDQAALDNFSFEVPAGRIVAILGPNGSGKSTVIKLMCRLYDPDAGRITIDGVDLRDIDLDDLRCAISPLFQMPVHYYLTVGENIALSDLPNAPTQEMIEAAAKAAGAHEIISRLPGGYDSVLGRGFKYGTELSGGEWQRIALARAFLRPAPILLLDEPTSAMDSWAEADWMDRFRRLARGRTAMIVTHRLSTAMRADTIFVMERGRVVESGSHDALLSAGGLYAASWASQMKESAGARVAPVGSAR